MKILRQLLRQPIKTFIGIILITLAVAILCVSVGQAFAVKDTDEKLREQFSTIAIPQYQKESQNGSTQLSVLVEDDVLDWVRSLETEHPGIVKDISYHGILSAHIPELVPLNITEEKYSVSSGLFSIFQAEPYAVPYSCAMFVITLDEIGESEEKTSTHYSASDRLKREDFEDYKVYLDYLQRLESVKATAGYSVKLTGTVTEVISLQEGYRDPTGRTVKLTLTAPTLEYIESLDLIPGKQYLVYGMDYVDEYWKLIGQLNLDGRYDWMDFESFDSSKLQLMTEEERLKCERYYQIYKDPVYRDAYAWFFGIMIDKSEYELVNSISMTLDMPLSLIEYDEIRDEEGVLQELVPRTEVSYTDINGETVTLSNEEYSARYHIPNIARLDGSVENFLKSSEGELWKKAIERDEINNRAFAVICVDNMNYLADFSLQKAKITQGRDFTADELNGGGKVCIIHEELAEANGVELGDKITLSLYKTDQVLPYQNIRSGPTSILSSSAAFYFDTTPFTETAEYTVVGICRGERTFPDLAENIYEFSANTVYVPKSSLKTEPETCNTVPFVTVVINNGKLEEFHELVLKTDFVKLFKYNDQGYSEIAGNFQNYGELAKQVVIAGAVLYFIIVLLFTVLYTSTQRKTTETMRSLGAGIGRRYYHVFASNSALIAISSLLGCLLGAFMWDFVAEFLQKTAESAVLLQLEFRTLLLIAAAQLIIMLFLNAIASISAVCQKGMLKRR